LGRENEESKIWAETTNKKIVEDVRGLVDKYHKPIVAVTVTTDVTTLKKVIESKLPAYTTLETAAKVLSKMYEYKKRREKILAEEKDKIK
ncbi:MAG: hypothetical protein QXO71_08130, partial [Candidatus Jordarchaeaceae archaeon]